MTVRGLVREQHSAHHESHKKILSQAENIITQHARVGADRAQVPIPSWLFGHPVVNTREAARYVAARLVKGGFSVTVECPNPYTEPDQLYLEVEWGEAAQRRGRLERQRRNEVRRARRTAEAKSAKEDVVSGSELVGFLKGAVKAAGARR